MLEAFEQGKRAGHTIVALTDGLLSPLAMGADHSFAISAASVSPFDSHVGTLALFDLLVGRDRRAAQGLGRRAARAGRDGLGRGSHADRRLITGRRCVPAGSDAGTARPPRPTCSTPRCHPVAHLEAADRRRRTTERGEGRRAAMPRRDLHDSAPTGWTAVTRGRRSGTLGEVLVDASRTFHEASDRPSGAQQVHGLVLVHAVVDVQLAAGERGDLILQSTMAPGRQRGEPSRYDKGSRADTAGRRRAARRRACISAMASA